MVKLAVILIVVVAAFLGAIGQIFFKLASASLSANILSWIMNSKLIIGLSLYGVATIITLIALKYGNLSVLYPVVATSYVWVAIFSVIFLGETMTSFRWLGIGLILSGVIFVIR